MSTLAFRDVLDRISEACSMIVYFHIWSLTWMNIWTIEETTKYCKWNWGLCYYHFYYLFIDALWDPALRCDGFVCEFSIFLYWPFHTYSSQFVLMCFLCIYTYSTSLLYTAFINFSEVLSCVCYSACFHTISLYAFVFRKVPSLLLLLTDRRPPGLLSAHSLVGGMLPSPYHRRFNNVFVTIFFIYYSFCVLFYFK